MAEVDKTKMKTEESGKDENRGQWGNQIEFILACVGYAVGLGNVWRFPYLTYKNGGGAFLIPYFISLFIAGLPIFYLELCLGQFSSLGPNCIFGKIAPIMQGIGWGMAVVSFIVAIYYNMIIAWVLYYFIASFRKTLLWSSCTFGWNTENCYSNLDEARCILDFGEGAKFFNKTCFNLTAVQDLNINYKLELLKNSTHQSSPAEEFFELYVLNKSEGFDEIGALQWKLVLALLGAWIIVFLCLIKGVQSTGKVVYFTATFPYVVLVILLIRGATLKGAADGVYFYITPQMDKLADIGVWKDAAIQIFYSLGPAFGGLLTMSSYNKFHNNCHRDAIIVALLNCGTSLFAGFAIFSIAGFMANDLGTDVKHVVRDGTGLAFIAYPEAIARMPVAPLWAILFFFMLITLGLDSQFAMVETVTTAVLDQFPMLRKWKTLVVASACAVCFVCGLPLCTRGGIFVFTLLNDYSAGFCIIMLALLEVITVFYLYGLKKFVKDLQLMLGVSRNPIAKVFGATGWYFRITWFGITPVFLLCILVFSFVFYKPSKYGSYKFEGASEAAGWITSAVSLTMVPAFAIYHIIRNRRNGKPWRDLFRATPEWCPAHDREKKVAQAQAQDMYKMYPQLSGPPSVIPTQPVYPTNLVER